MFEEVQSYYKFDIPLLKAPLFYDCTAPSHSNDQYMRERSKVQVSLNDELYLFTKSNETYRSYFRET